MIYETIDSSPRGCGSLKKGGYYLNGGSSSSAGIFQAVTYFGGLLADDMLVASSVPARKMLTINPAASIANGEVVLAESRSEDPVLANVDMYLNLKDRVNVFGIVDHVGSNSYTAQEFVSELAERLANRRITKQFAKTIAPFLPLPIWFTQKLPVFDSVDELERVAEMIRGLTASYDQISIEYGGCWNDETWGMYAHHSNGVSNASVLIMDALHKFERNEYPKSAEWLEVKDIVMNKPFVEQPFVSSWINRAVVVVSGEDESDVDINDLMSGIVPVVPAKEGNRVG